MEAELAHWAVAYLVVGLSLMVGFMMSDSEQTPVLASVMIMLFWGVLLPIALVVTLHSRWRGGP